MKGRPSNSSARCLVSNWRSGKSWLPLLPDQFIASSALSTGWVTLMMSIGPGVSLLDKSKNDEEGTRFRSLLMGCSGEVPTKDEGAATSLSNESKEVDSTLMNIIARADQFRQRLFGIRDLSTYDWKCCPHCGSEGTDCNGGYHRHPYTEGGRIDVYVQCHICKACRRSYYETDASLIKGSHYSRSVHRMAIDHCVHFGSSVRKTAELLRSLVGHQERWRLWNPLSKDEPRVPCTLAPSTIQRWLDRAGAAAEKSIPGQAGGARLSRAGGHRRAVGQDEGQGLPSPPRNEGLCHGDHLSPGGGSRGGDQGGLEGDVRQGRRCRPGPGGTPRGGRRRGQGTLRLHEHPPAGGQPPAVRLPYLEEPRPSLKKQGKRGSDPELVALVRAVLDSPSRVSAEAALVRLSAVAGGKALAKRLLPNLDAALVHTLRFNEGIARVGPEWMWRDFRLRLSHGRNHGSDSRLERTALVWAIYHNFQPTQERREKRRRYRHPGLSPLEVAGHPPGQASYLDALAV